jgi:hypothetical protein
MVVQQALELLELFDDEFDSDSAYESDSCDGSWGKDVTRATCVVLALLPLSMCTFQTRIHQRYVM